MVKTDIKRLTLAELKESLRELGVKPYRAEQVFYWLYNRGVDTFASMKNIPGEIIEMWDEHFYIMGLKLSETQRSKDGTAKFLFELEDGNFIESVLIPHKTRETLCISTQVGCRFVCGFCASGRMGFERNLTTSEITGQVLYALRRSKAKVSNYVFMGMGEPLDNYDNLAKSILIMNESKGLAIGARRITISTCGIVPGIKKLRDFGLQVNLSISLHASTDRLRNELVTANKIYPLKGLIKACKEYAEATGRVITLEYVLIKGKNDSVEDTAGLSKIARDLRAKVNVIAYSDIGAAGYNTPSRREIAVFMNRLREKGVNVTLRRSAGADIQAACGQLAGRRRCRDIRL
ncbi:MAG: 23S rRNA (adenine(2503)-C(2))-methyltransferase RlmN [Candidatus Omnitrophica bacterium]|nr:23S rRNA (adenine(2503)-C(2))-methyltransferase RlmN [Candidatus Omnitrophota bacterium]